MSTIRKRKKDKNEKNLENTVRGKIFVPFVLTRMF
jgi:hypothetical protein